MTEHSVDTFEHDIVDEIRHREASISDIATAVGDIGNDAPTTSPKNSLVIMSIGVMVALCMLVGLGYFGYSYYIEGKPTPKEQFQNTNLPEKKIPSGLQLSAVSPSLSLRLGTFLTNPQKVKDGYVITINSYSPVFSYMLRNEIDFGDEIALAVGNTHTIKAVASTTPVLLTTVSTSSIATTTKKIATSTTMLATTTPSRAPSDTLSTNYVFSDVTVSNQNMRVGKSVYGTVVYAFIGTQKLVISSSIEGILALRSNVLQK